jgi:hypothetical protein
VSHLVEVALARLAREHPDYHTALQRSALDGTPCADIAARSARPRATSTTGSTAARKARRLSQGPGQEYSLSRQDYDEELKYLSKFFP